MTILSEAIPSTNRILILNYGSQYIHLITRRCRECSVYAHVFNYDVSIDLIKEFNPVGIILSGGPASAYDADAPHVCKELWDYVLKNEIPILGICYGMQDMHHQLEGKVETAEIGEYGSTKIYLTEDGVKDVLFKDIHQQTTVWMSHRDIVVSTHEDFKLLAYSDICSIGAVSCPKRFLWSVQFHPEVMHTQQGRQIFSNFFHKICKIPEGFWTMHRFLFSEIQRLRSVINKRHVIGAISGGVDSIVASSIVYRAIGQQFYGFLVDTGLLRKNEVSDVTTLLKKEVPDMKLTVIDASAAFFEQLVGVTDPEEKRKRIGHLFVKTFMDAVEKLKENSPTPEMFENAYLLQGTICTDVVESAKIYSGISVDTTQKIKTHHNVGGLPEELNIELLEPLRKLFKDEVRTIGLELGLNPALLQRHPFPGPGLAIRIIGEVKPEYVTILQQVDAIFMEELIAAGDYKKIGQAFAVLLPNCRTVGVCGDVRSYGMTVALRAVQTSDFMTADCYELPYDILKKCSTRIMNEIKSINRVCYDVSSKPPATIEWE